MYKEYHIQKSLKPYKGIQAFEISQEFIYLAIN